MTDRFDLWGRPESNPTAYMTVHGLDPEPLIESARVTLHGLRFPDLKYRDAKLQWGDQLRAMGSAWVAWVLNRGGRTHWSNVLADAILDEPGNSIPWVREHIGEQTLILTARSVGTNISEFVLSGEQRIEGSGRRLFARNALHAIAKSIEARGVQIANIRAVSSKDLPPDCPAHRVTRIVLERDAKKKR